MLGAVFQLYSSKNKVIDFRIEFEENGALQKIAEKGKFCVVKSVCTN